MERVHLAATVRNGLGKSGARQLRRSGQVPAVVYGKGRESQPLAVEGKALSATLHTHAGLNVLIDLGIQGDAAEDRQLVMVKDVQRDVLSHGILHVDFHVISLEETLETHVPVLLVGTPKGVVDGGVLEQHLREVLVECLPTQIPEHFELDVTGLTIGHAVHAGELTIPEGVTLLTPTEEVVATVQQPRVEEAPAAPAAAEAVPAEGEAVEGEAAERPAPGAAPAKEPEAEEK
ncbi:MAG TPA: 50S ribosomal protein L25 [bacterium]|jgi:large subunit ribosomal protein L25|nr:50S ribosomal protein L25 [bacterium]